MDIHLFRDGGHFSHFDTHNFMAHYPDDSTSLDAVSDFSSKNGAFHWDMECEREINGDLALVPVSSNFCNTLNIDQITKSPPCKDDFQKIMNDWQQFISLDIGCDEFPIDDPILIPEANEDETPVEKTSPFHEILNLSADSSFDITSYVNDEEPKPAPNIPVRKPKAGVKKIDLKAQRYIVDEDEDDVDVETISECENSPVLEAGDLNSLLEQFEATEMPDLPANFMETNSDVKVEHEEVTIKQEPLETHIEEMHIENNFLDKSSVICKPEIVKVKKELIEKDVVKIKNEATIEVKSVKKEPKNDINSVKKEKKAETQKEVCKVKDECKPIKMELIAKTEHANLPENRENKTQYPIGTDTDTIPTVISLNNKSTNENLLPLTPQHEKSPQQSIPSKKDKPAKTLQTANTSTESTTSDTLDSTKNKQIMDSFPEELIARIKESGKRKTISVIPPFPSKKRGVPRMQEAGPQPSRSTIKLVNPETVQLDHDYCSLNNQYSKCPKKKDSDFESAEEDDRAIMRKQPMVKNADGKLMVSLLKVNTIRNTESCQKKKLNLEEYKKRREGFLKSQSSSQNCSPISRNCSSPMLEDENTRRIKHQEKLMKMAMEVLNTPPKSERKSDPPLVVTPPQPIPIPSDMEKKTLVSIGINTDFKICRNMNPVTPVEQLEEIKPLLKKVKINCNSLITSLIENIPKVINKSDPKDLKPGQTNKLEHGEDKTIVYLPKNRTAIKTNSVEVQTNISLIQQSKQSRYRRRTSSSSSSSSGSSCDSRKSRTSSPYSRRQRQSECSSSSSRSSRTSRSDSFSSSYSSRSSSPHSRSRSRSPRCTRRERERLREVEERRVIYVGRISSNTSREDLRKRFQKFGPITNVSLHFRDHGDNYGFVTFANKLDAYEAIEHGNDDPYHPKYDLSFGGRRIFCKTTYSDLDNMRDETSYFSPRIVEDSFDTLLREAQEKLRKRKA